MRPLRLFDNFAGIAQLVERAPRKGEAGCSIHPASTRESRRCVIPCRVSVASGAPANGHSGEPGKRGAMGLLPEAQRDGGFYADLSLVVEVLPCKQGTGVRFLQSAPIGSIMSLHRRTGLFAIEGLT